MEQTPQRRRGWPKGHGGVLYSTSQNKCGLSYGRDRQEYCIGSYGVTRRWKGLRLVRAQGQRKNREETRSDAGTRKGQLESQKQAPALVDSREMVWG